MHNPEFRITVNLNARIPDTGLPCTAELLTSLEMENINIYTPFGNPLEPGNIYIYRSSTGILY